MITRLLDGLKRRRSGRPAASKASADPSRIEIVYAPESDGDADPGEVVWTWVSYEDDPSQGKDRPVVVLGRWGADLAAVALTSKEHGLPGDRVAVGTGAWDPQHRPSFAKVGRLLAIDPTKVRREGSAFDRGQFTRLVAAVREHHRDLSIVEIHVDAPRSKR